MAASDLTEKQKIFCREYILDWNATRAAKVAGYSENTASEMGYENLNKPQIKAYIEEIKSDIEKQAGISALGVALEYKKLAFSSLADLQRDWLTLEEWDALTPDQKACISEIKRTTRKVKTKGSDDEELETIQIKLHDKNKALDSLTKLLGYNAPEKHDHTIVEQPLFTKPKK